MRAIYILLLFVSGVATAQNNMAHFTIWKPIPGKESNFETGYKKHLQWHKENGDKWSWYGWYVILGPRVGWFIDATFNHAWADFDKPVKQVEDRQDSRLHVSPFGDYQGNYKVAFLPALSISDTGSLKSKYLRMLTLQVTSMDTAKRVIDKLKAAYQGKGSNCFLTYKMADGGPLNQFQLFIGFSSYEDYGKSENIIEEINQAESSLKVKTVSSVVSETLMYLPDMSRFPD
jgi:hypothetical protein